MQRSHRVFGYGSLVNRDTHGYRIVAQARIRGWRRMWVHARSRKVAFLSVHPAPGAVIEGLVLEIPPGEWPDLLERERAYLPIPVQAEPVGGGRLDALLFHAAPEAVAPPSRGHPVRLSYLDTVIGGYLQAFGPAGAARFFTTTDGWDAPIMDDRHTPFYPRHVPADAQVRRIVAQGLERVGARVIPPPGISAPRDASRPPPA